MTGLGRRILRSVSIPPTFPAILGSASKRASRAAAEEAIADAETCEARHAEIVALHGVAAGLLDERRKLEDRAREDRRSGFAPPTELQGYADWLARCGRRANAGA